MQLAAESIIEVGRELIEQKKSLGHGNYLDWVERELGLSRMTASKLVNVAEKFGGNVKAPLHLSFEALSALAALYALAAPSKVWSRYAQFCAYLQFCIV